ncbi:hypothetical protein EG338_07355 [Kaistella haifensis]|nr:hypothetical protein EG338_07355 [Kaistella haifensis]
MKIYRDIEIIGKGGNGIVWEVQDSKNNKFAKKTIKHYKKNIPYKRFCDEIEVIKNNAHIGVIKIVDYYIPKSTLKETPYYIMPIGIPLHNCLSKFPIEKIWDFIVKIIDTLEYLHNKEITHRDIKIENILMVENYPTLSDFGLANFPKQKRLSRINEKIGPAFTIAPEMRRISSVAEYKKADIYSLAKTIWVMLTQKWKSFDGQYNTHSSISLKNYVDLKINEITNYGEPNYFSLVVLDKLLFDATHNDPDKRPTIQEFKRRFNFWLDSNDNYELRNEIEWEDAIRKIFPVSVPLSSKWDNILEIKNVLEIIFTHYDNLNYTFFPYFGGLDLTDIKIIEIDYKEYLVINDEYFLEPKCLYFESMNDFSWSYFRLEVIDNKGFFGKNINRNEEKIYIDVSMKIHVEQVENSKQLNFIVKNSFLIVQKTAKINSLRGKLDHHLGIHNKITNDQYRNLLQKIQISHS